MAMKESETQLVSIKSLESLWSFRNGERLCPVTGYTRSSAMEQAMCSAQARLVCGGTHQIEDIDCQAMYAPTARLGHVRLALTIAAEVQSRDPSNGRIQPFLAVDLEEEIYMHPPQGYFHLVQTGS